MTCTQIYLLSKIIFIERILVFHPPPFTLSLLLNPFFLHFNRPIEKSCGWCSFCFGCPKSIQISFWNSHIYVVCDLDGAVIPGDHIPFPKLKETDPYPPWLSQTRDQACNSVVRSSFWGSDHGVGDIQTAGKSGRYPCRDEGWHTLLTCPF